MKRDKVTERRIEFVLVFIHTFSLKKTLQVISKKFGASIDTLMVDWGRRQTWPKEVFEHIDDAALRDLYLMAIHKTIGQIEREFARTKNPSCKAGLLKTKAQILFKLIELQQWSENNGLVKRIEDLEKRLDFLVSEKRKDEVE